MNIDQLVKGQPYKYVNWHNKITEALYNKPVMLPNKKIYYNFYLRKGFVNLTKIQVVKLIFDKDTDDKVIREQISQEKGCL